MSGARRRGRSGDSPFALATREAAIRIALLRAVRLARRAIIKTAEDPVEGLPLPEALKIARDASLEVIAEGTKLTAQFFDGPEPIAKFFQKTVDVGVHRSDAWQGQALMDVDILQNVKQSALHFLGDSSSLNRGIACLPVDERAGSRNASGGRSTLFSPPRLARERSNQLRGNLL